MPQLSLSPQLRQELRLTAQLLQSIEILQMNSQDLLEYLGKLTEENPVLEQSSATDLLEAYAALRRRAAWIDAGAFGATFSHGEGAQDYGAEDRELASLQAFLRDQLERLRLPERLLLLCRYLAALVDEDGYLAQEDLDDLTKYNVPEDLLQTALHTLQSLDPAGVGARSLSECLVLQLRRLPDAPPFAEEIAARFLPQLGRGHDGRILRELKITEKELRAAERAITQLEPHPGRAFSVAEPTVFVRPDVFIAQLDGEWQVLLNEYYLPRITISPYYQSLARSCEEKETKDYLAGKLRQAKWLLDSLDRRGSTLRRCAQAILDAQKPFFEGTTDALAPMNLSALAAELHLHPSTVSRAVGGKYLQCRRGTYPLRYFFSRAVGEATSRQAIGQKLLSLIRAEDPAKPLSDQALCKLLSEDGVPLARRTVAKYRAQLAIPSSTVRKTARRRD